MLMCNPWYLTRSRLNMKNDGHRMKFTLNLLLFAKNLFCSLSGINWLAVTNFHDQDVDYIVKNIIL